MKPRVKWRKLRAEVPCMPPTHAADTATPALPQRRRRAARTRTASSAITMALLVGGGVASGFVQPAAIARAAGPVTDSFSRTVTDGWGSADSGGGWFAQGTAERLSVAGGVGRLALATDGLTAGAFLETSDTSDADLRAVVSSDKVATGNGIYISVVGRRVAGAGQYQAKIRLLPGGAVGVSLTRTDAAWSESVVAAETVVPGLSFVPGGQLAVRLRVAGTGPTALQVKVWARSSAEPASWFLSGTDSTAAMQTAGVVGFTAYLSRSAINAPVSVGVDDLSLGTPATPTPTGERQSASAGAAAVGTTRYDVPAAAGFVSPSGEDGAAGTSNAPWRTVAHAVAATASGGTVVLRAGTYHEMLSIPAGKRLTVQSYPGEAAWFDGSTVVTTWSSDGPIWRSDGWTASFDHSPTYTPGAPDNTQPGWSFVNAGHPMAAYPDQIWIDGVSQRQVGSRSDVTAGTFFVDTVGDHLYLGSNPGGHVVRASDLSTAITVNGAGSVLRGFGVRRYATSLPLKGTVKSLAADVRLENLEVSDNATQGIYVGGKYLGTGNVLNHVTARGNGLLGIESSYADGLSADHVRASGNNTEHFNLSPVSGGLKITRVRNISITDSVFSGNEGPGLWMDESVYNARVTGNDLTDNVGHGLSFEISAKAVLADNLVKGNGGNGMKLNNSSDLQVWNNTFVDNRGKPLWLVQDSRVASNLSTPGHDPRQPLPDPTVTWLLGPATVKNNIFVRTSSICFLCVEDSALHRSAAAIGVTADGNVYNRPTTSSPSWLVVWANGGANPLVFSSLSSVRSTVGQEAHGAEFTGAAVIDAQAKPTSGLLAVESTTAQPLPTSVAALVGRVPGALHLGVWFN